jgi:hypothetical protein
MVRNKLIEGLEKKYNGKFEEYRIVEHMVNIDFKEGFN